MTTVIASLVLTLAVSAAHAGVHFTGQIVQDGVPVNGVHQFTLVSSTASLRVTAAPYQVSLPCIEGHFATELPFSQNEWVGVGEVQINFDGTDLGPAMPKGQVPEAYFANAAAKADSAIALINPPPQTGVAFTNHDPPQGVSFSGSPALLTSITVNVPAAGYVRVEVTGNVTNQLQATCFFFKLATSAPSPTFDGITECIDATTRSFGLSQLFTVASAGSHTFRLYGRRSGSTLGGVSIAQIQAVWIPASIAP